MEASFWDSDSNDLFWRDRSPFLLISLGLSFYCLNKLSPNSNRFTSMVRQSIVGIKTYKWSSIFICIILRISIFLNIMFTTIYFEKDETCNELGLQMKLLIPQMITQEWGECILSLYRIKNRQLISFQTSGKSIWKLKSMKLLYRQ